ncbi:MAG TPA: hypothetical protein VF736_21215 [Pyrinomonadaceae bacterium]|jgi:hypothetical protein
MRIRVSLLLPVILLLSAAAASAQKATYTPAPGSAERKAITDALRAPVERELRQKVVFKVDGLKVQGGWAFLRGVPQTPDGGRLDYKATSYRQQVEEGVFDDGVVALLRKQAGRWRVVKYVIGATDVPYVTWDKDYKAPSAIFK